MGGRADPKSPWRQAESHATEIIGSSSSAESGRKETMADQADGRIQFDLPGHTVISTTGSEATSDHGDTYKDLPELQKPRTRTLGRLKLRGQFDHDPTDWWFASTAIPLMAATFAPMANLISIAALVVSWRNTITTDDAATKYLYGDPIKDPTWCYDLNAVSLACGFAGNLFLLFNFTQRVRYIVALPVTIFFFYMASGILIGIVVSMDRYVPPTPTQVYSQGYWHAVIAACLYMLNSMILMVNMFGYFLGHYPQHFTLNMEQRNLILQTMLFFVWLGGGAAVFSHIGGWTYPDALYFCDVTILTIGFGDYYAQSDLGKGLVFPFSVGGTIILGLMVNSIHKFARELSKEKVVRKHVEQRRVDTLSRAVTLEQLDDKNLNLLAEGKTLHISSPLQSDKDHVQRQLDELARQEREKRRLIEFPGLGPGDDAADAADARSPSVAVSAPIASPQFVQHRNFQKSMRALTLPLTRPVSLGTQRLRRVRSRNQKKILMIEERDRFNAMRKVQIDASRFKRYYALLMSILSFSMLWCLGAMVFYFAESETQQLNYFQGLYFCYVSLLTIGYGDLSPKSNAGKAFFVVWSLIAVPTMTILVSDLGDTVIGGFKRGVLENDLGLTSSSKPTGHFMTSVYRILHMSPKNNSVEGPTEVVPDKGLEDGQHQQIDGQQDEDNEVKNGPPKTIDELASQNESDTDMLKHLALAIRQAAEDLRNNPGKKYRYEEWVEFSRLIRFSKRISTNDETDSRDPEDDEANEAIIEWDWLDEKSPMTSEQPESEWVLARLCESLLRVFKRGDLLASILANSMAPVEKGKTRSPHRHKAHGSPERIPPPYRMSPASMDEDIDHSQSLNAMTRLLQGEGNNAGLKWSKRAQARRAAVNQNIERRRSSASLGNRKQDQQGAGGRTSIDTKRQLQGLGLE